MIAWVAMQRIKDCRHLKNQIQNVVIEMMRKYKRIRHANLLWGFAFLLFGLIFIPYSIVGYLYGFHAGFKFVTTGGAILGGRIEKGHTAFLIIFASVGIVFLLGGIRCIRRAICGCSQ